MNFEESKKEVKLAIKALKLGKSVIILDNENRENEGDMIFPGQLANTQNVNMMLKYTTGIICLSMEQKHAEQLELSSMVPKKFNTNHYTTNFTVSIEAKNGVTTGVSAADRTRTIQVASNPKVMAHEINRPGHIFPLISHPYGVLGRQGHTEASIDIVKMSGFYPVAVLSELMNEDGTIMKKKEIKQFSLKHNLPILNIESLRLYRIAHDKSIKKMVTTMIPLHNYGTFDISIFLDPITNKEIKVLSKNINHNPLVRIHSSCFTGDIFGSLKCDCKSQLDHALKKISKEGGILIYLHQEGRDIGLINKLKAYNLQLIKNLNTVEANKALSLPVDNRKYDLAIKILNYYKIKSCFLISNNPDKINSLTSVGIKVTVVPSESLINKFNKNYLKTKKEELDHTIKGI